MPPRGVGSAGRAAARRALWAARRSLRWFAPRDLRRNVAVQRAVSTRAVALGTPRTTRAWNALTSVSRDGAPDGPIWAVSMTRNESDIIEETVLHLLEQGVDRVVVADNGSEDDTPHILRSLTRTHPVHVIEDPLRTFWQAEKVTLLARLAARMGAGWIVPFDADELWFGEEDSTVAQTLHGSSAAVVTAAWFDFLPILVEPGERYAERFPYRLAAPASLPKVAFRANWLARVTNGNHAVTLPDPRTEPGLRVAHYRFRSVEQMVQKARDGSENIRRSGLPVNVSYWRRIAEGGVDAAVKMLEELSRDELVFDPACSWQRRR